MGSLERDGEIRSSHSGRAHRHLTVDMTSDVLADRFEKSRKHLRAVAYRMLGSLSEADDAVQEAWLRLSRTDASTIDNLGGWLTTVVARISLDMLRARRLRSGPDPIVRFVDDGGGGVDVDARDGDADADDEGVNAEAHAIFADSVSVALLVVLETLAPPERLAFVLHDMFDVPFDEIAPIVGKSAAAARQLASRARRRVQGASSS